MKNIASFITLLCFATHIYPQSECNYWEWAKGAGSTSFDQGNDIATDTDGNIYVTGEFYSPAQFGNITLTGTGGKDVFIAKMDTYGNFLWAVGTGTSRNDKGNAIAIDQSGNVYVTGSWNQQSTSTAASLFVGKLDNNGNWLWIKHSGSNGANSGQGIAIDPSGSVLITGMLGTATFGNTTLTELGDGDIFVAKLDINGNWIWAKQAGGSNSDDFSFGISLDGLGNSYISGYYAGGSISFGSTSLSGSGSSKNIFVAKLDASGNWQWAKKVGSNCTVFETRSHDIVTDISGNSYITGVLGCETLFGSTSLQNGMFIAKINSTGDWIWARNGGDNNTYGYSVTLDNNNNIHVCGTYSGTVNFGSNQLTSSMGSTFIVQLDATGNWMRAIGCSGKSYGLAVNQDGYNYITGSISTTSLFGIHTLLPSGNNDMHVAKLIHTIPTPINNPQTICSGSSYSIGPHTYTFADTYTDILQSIHGCDSIVNTILTVENPDLNPAVSLLGSTLTAVENNASYQWVDCNNNNVYISGATEQSFTPSLSGSYAVILNSNFEACSPQTVTSSCYSINTVGIYTDVAQIDLDVFPNPTNSNITVNSKVSILPKIHILDISGKELICISPITTQTELDLTSLASGLYFLRMNYNGQTYTVRVIKM